MAHHDLDDGDGLPENVYKKSHNGHMVRIGDDGKILSVASSFPPSKIHMMKFEIEDQKLTKQLKQIF